MSDIHVKSYWDFVDSLPLLVHKCTGMRVKIDRKASIHETAGKRYVSAQECLVRGLTYALTVVTDDAHSILVMQIPMILPDGTFVVKGQSRIIMLRKKRAPIPIRLGDAIAIFGGKLRCKQRRFTPSHTKEAMRIDNADKLDLSVDMLNYAADCGLDWVFDQHDVSNARLQLPGDMLTILIASVLRQQVSENKRLKKGWREYTVTAPIFSAMATGNWRNTGLIGVTQLTNQNNNTALQMKLRTVINNSKALQSRFVHPSTAGFFCVSDTPEGQNVGLIQLLCDGVQVTTHDDNPTYPYAKSARGDTTCFINGKWLGKCTETSTPCSKGTTVVRRTIAGKKEAWIWSDAGRMKRQNFTPEKDILGYLAKQIPFAPHNQTPRISYYCNMAKQAMECAPPTYDTTCHRLLYAQKPLLSPSHEDAAGVNVILAINCAGYNQEDAIVVAKGALDRGLFRSIEYKTYSAQIAESGTDDTIDTDGVIAKGIQVQSGDTLMASRAGVVKVQPRSARHVMIDEAIMAPSEQIAKVRTVAMRKPVVGDKFTSRFGQKGVIGAIVPDEDLPFTADGIRPDVIINAHAFPSRMTVGQIMEMAGAKVNVITPNKVQGTPWNESHTIEQISAELAGAGMEWHGRERMYNGKTGEMMEEPIFIAPCWYQRLTHLATEKCYARGANGPIDQVTRQPTKGRKKGGGIRIGEMEKDVLLSAGAVHVLQDKAESIGHDTHQGVQIPHATKLLFQELQAMGIGTQL